MAVWLIFCLSCYKGKHWERQAKLASREVAADLFLKPWMLAFHVNKKVLLRRLGILEISFFLGDINASQWVKFNRRLCLKQDVSTKAAYKHHNKKLVGCQWQYRKRANMALIYFRWCTKSTLCKMHHFISFKLLCCFFLDMSPICCLPKVRHYSSYKFYCSTEQFRFSWVRSFTALCSKAVLCINTAQE